MRQSLYNLKTVIFKAQVPHMALHIPEDLRQLVLKLKVVSVVA